MAVCTNNMPIWPSYCTHPNANSKLWVCTCHVCLQTCQHSAIAQAHDSPGGSILHIKYSEPRRSRLRNASSSDRCQASGLVTWGSSARARSENGCHCTPALTSTASVSALHVQKWVRPQQYSCTALCQHTRACWVCKYETKRCP